MYQKSENVVARKIHGAFFLIDIADNYSGDCCALYEINQTGMFLWENLGNGNSAEALAKLLQAAIVDPIDYSVILSDVNDFLNVLMEKNFVLEVA